MASNKADVIFETTFPMYSVRAMGDRHLLVAGGGGQAKTGVPNRLEVFLFDICDGSWDFRKTTIIETGIEATMNLDMLPVDVDKGKFLIACGQEGNCRIYETHFDIAEFRDGELVHPVKHSPSSVSKKRRTTSTSSSDLNNATATNTTETIRKLTLAVDERRSFQSDFTPGNNKCGGPFQKVVRFTSNGSSLITGGGDGHFRVWDTNNGRKILDHNAHKDDIDDLDISPDGAKLLTIGRDGAGFVWQTKDAAKLADLSKDKAVLPPKYRFRFARFASALCTKCDFTFFTVSIPVVRTSKKQSCFIARWTINEQNNCRTVANTALPANEVVSAFAISADGQFIGLGTLGGSLLILDTKYLRLLKVWPEAHGIFVTSLEFLPSSAKYQAQSSFCPLLAHSKCALISVSADNYGQLHVLNDDNGGNSYTTSFIYFFLFFLLLFYLFAWLEL